MVKNWAIAIGLNRYDLLQPLKYAKRDAQLMQEFLRNEAGFEPIYFFSDDSPDIAGKSTRPNRTNLLRILRQLFENPFLGAGDNFWFFFSGHGIRHNDRDYLMPCDGDPEDIENTAIAINFVTERLRRCGADNVVLILDACRSLAQKGGEGIGRQTAEQARQQGVISIFSCSPQEYSYEIEALQQGAFTTALLEGLGIQGQCATVERLNQYLSFRVSEIVQQHQNGRQTPYIIAEPVNKSHLILVPQYATLQDIATLKNDAYQAEVAKNFELAEQLWMRVLAAASGQDVDAVRALQRIARLSVEPQYSESALSNTQNSGKETSTKSTPPQPQLPSLILPRRRFIQIVGLVGAGVGSAIVGERLLSGSKNKSQPKTPASYVTQAPTSQNPLQTFKFDVVTVDARGKITSTSTREAKYFVKDLGNGVTLDMVQIPGGTFMMGSPQGEIKRNNDEEQHSVKVPEFFMGKYEVTQAQYQAIIGNNPSSFKGEKRPVENVTWNDAVEFCQQLSQKTRQTYRLPSEAEWEYACRAGTKTPFYFGETITTDLVNYDGNYTYASTPKGEVKYRRETTPVGIFPPNSFGLYDMHGNTWEWCLASDRNKYEGESKDGSTWLLRGGSWNSHPWGCRSANRFKIAERSNNIGFRLVCVVA
ncbi:MAG: SUMF1/EgtB/PvdO family nonheme iron enzyme [Aulosira sp. ZfuVER01]|nr:SUMF1/EgtB/PvdO family nonheme iron enzyme [Aulosira sp. ZfuVER01]MDZ7998007.1 SUMF1/EgtB/PvdO family nonheme iron enzyme [Aulosira sp. DedVER01a]MDZ8050401.1 SUMF1/EgtB/PvdO family nonheme iron enzyme [Aulosira sp. ZfuCHP01]